MFDRHSILRQQSGPFLHACLHPCRTRIPGRLCLPQTSQKHMATHMITWLFSSLFQHWLTQRHQDMSHPCPLLQSVLTSSLDSSSEDVKAVASQALGGVAIGNLSTYLPFILRQIQNQVCFALLPFVEVRSLQKRCESYRSEVVFGAAL